MLFTPWKKMSITDALSCVVATGQCVKEIKCNHRDSGDLGAAHTKSIKDVVACE